MAIGRFEVGKNQQLLARKTAVLETTTYIHSWLFGESGFCEVYSVLCSKTNKTIKKWCAESGLYSNLIRSIPKNRYLKSDLKQAFLDVFKGEAERNEFICIAPEPIALMMKITFDFEKNKCSKEYNCILTCLEKNSGFSISPITKYYYFMEASAVFLSVINKYVDADSSIPGIVSEEWSDDILEDSEVDEIKLKMYVKSSFLCAICNHFTKAWNIDRNEFLCCITGRDDPNDAKKYWERWAIESEGKTWPTFKKIIEKLMELDKYEDADVYRIQLIFYKVALLCLVELSRREGADVPDDIGSLFVEKNISDIFL